MILVVRPDPPSATIRTLVIALVAMLVIGATVLLALSRFGLLQQTGASWPG